MNKSIFYLLVIIGLALSIGVASASENTDTPLAVDESQLEIENNNPLSKEDNTLKETQTSESEMNSNIPTDSKLEVPQNNPTLNAGEGTFAELQELIENNYDGTIVLNNSYFFNTDFNREGITITSQITIDGNNNVLDGKNLGRIFNITGENVILKNIKFINGRTSGNGGAIHWINSNVNIINCTFENNRVYNGWGGANYFNNVTNVIITGNFKNNIRQEFTGSVLSFYDDANYFEYANNITITGNTNCANQFNNSNNIIITSNFTGNLANQFNSSNNITITGNFNITSSKMQGSANYFNGSNNIIITGNFTDITQNYPRRRANYFNGSNNIIITGNFTNCLANSFITSNNINISGEFNNNDHGTNSFEDSNNININGNFNNNGAVNRFITSNNININGNFNNNNGGYNGAVNHFITSNNINISGEFNNNDQGTNSFEDSNNININGNFTNNHANLGGANRFINSNNINISGEFTDNSAYGGGANYFNNGTNVTITANFNDNSAGDGYSDDNDGNGGANYFTNSDNITIIGNFNDNFVTWNGLNDDGNGGANCFEYSNNINIIGNFTNNRAEYGCGGANCFEYSNNINIIGNFNNNHASVDGANYFNSHNINIDGNFTNNTDKDPKLNAYFKDSIIYEKEALLIIEIKDGATGYISVDNVNENTGISVTVEEAVNNGININGLKTGNNIFKIRFSSYDETFCDGVCYAAVIVKNTTDEDREVADMEVSLPADVKVGDIVIMNVTLPGDATGTVTVFVNGKKVQNAKLENGKANIPIEGLASGNHTISITYSGNNKYLPTTSENMNLIISKVTPTITVKVDDIKAGEIATITVNVPEDATGIILVDVGVAISYDEIKDGKAIINIPGLAKGTYTVNAMLQYDPKYCDTNITGSFEVIKDPEYFIKVTMVNGLQLTAVLTDEDGNSITNAVVSYIINDGKAVNVTTNDKGEFVCDVQSNSIITMSYVNGNVSCSESIIIKNMALTQKQTQIIADLLVTRTAVDYNAGERGTKYYFYLKDKDGNALANKEIQIGVVGKIYKAKTDANGRAGIDISIANANSYTYALTFIGDSEYAAAFAVSELKIVKKLVTITPAKTSYSFKASAKTKTVAATLKSTNSYIPKGKQVTLTIAGKTFKATVGAKGQISFNIGSITKKGTYKVDVKFAGTNTYAAANSKTITIKIA